MITNIYERATLQDSFEYRGRWWLPEYPAEQMPGVVHFDKGRDIFLTLMGPVRKHHPDVMCGLCDGTECTLLNVSYDAHSSSRGQVTSTRLRVDTLLVGKRLDAKSNARFSSLRVNFADLAWWRGGSPFHKAFSCQQGEKLEFVFERPQAFETYVGALGAKLRIEHDLPYSVGTSFKCEHRAYVIVMPDEDRDVYWYRRFVFRLQSLLSLMMGRATHPVEMLANAEESLCAEDGVGWQPIRVYYCLPFRPEMGAPGVLQVRFEDIVDSFGSTLELWFQLVERYQPVYGPLMETIFNPAPYADAEFLSLTQALEGFHRRGFPGQYVTAGQYEAYLTDMVSRLPTNVPGDLRAAVIQRLQFGNEYSLRRRIKEILATLPASLGGRICGDSKELAETLTQMRNKLVHCPADYVMSGFDASELIWLTIKLRALLTVVLLRRIAVPDTALENAIRLTPFAI